MDFLSPLATHMEKSRRNDKSVGTQKTPNCQRVPMKSAGSKYLSRPAAELAFGDSRKIY